MDTAIIYQASPAITISYTCTGETLTYKCKLNGEAYLDSLLEANMEEEVMRWSKALEDMRSETEQ